jgi:cystathionine beta-lyase/cystathionine gamma-synthase
MKSSKYFPTTTCIHGTKKQQPGPAVEPIYQTSTFVFENQQEMLASVQGKSTKDVYTRWSNPTTRSVEEKISALECTEKSFAFASGMGAISAVVMGLLKRGDTMITSDSIYGGTLHLFEDILPQQGINVDFVDLEEFVDAVEDAKGKAKMCYFETPTNPSLRIIDIKKVATAAESAGAISVIDNTFATPINQRPHEMGIDVIIHSATKYLGGHSDIIAGTASADAPYIDDIIKTAKLLGATIDPFASFLLDRGLKTLGVRVEKHNKNARFLATELSKDRRISKIHYPGLQSHPNHKIAVAQMNGYGGMLTLDINGTLKQTEDFVDSLDLFLNAVSLGGVESLASIPALTTHYGIDESILQEMFICESTVRLSVGIENPFDLLSDIKSALDRVFG